MAGSRILDGQRVKTEAERFLRTALRGGAADWPARAGDEFTEALVEACQLHGVSALLHSSLERGGQWEGWPARVKHQLEREEGLALLRQEILDRELRTVLERLAGDGVPCLLVKGAAVSRLAYRQPHLRPRTDSDLWIRESDLASAQSALSEVGYQAAESAGGRLTQYQQGFRKTCTANCTHLLDLHWKISNVQLFAECLQFEPEWRDRAPLPALGPAAHTLNLLSSLLLACLHRVAHHGGSRKLIWLCDMRNLAANLPLREQERFLQRARELEIEAVCRDSLEAAFSAFGLPNPDTPLVKWLAKPPPGGEKSAQFLRHANSRGGILVSDLRQLPGLRLKLQFVKEHLFPSVQYMRQRHPGRSSLLLPWFYLSRGASGIWEIFVTRIRKVTEQD